MSRVNISPSRIRTSTRWRDSRRSRQASQAQTNDQLLQIVMSGAMQVSSNESKLLASRHSVVRSLVRHGVAEILGKARILASAGSAVDAPNLDQADWPEIWHDTTDVRGWALWNILTWRTNLPLGDQTLRQLALKLGWIGSWQICLLYDTSDAPQTGGMVLLEVYVPLLDNDTEIV